MVAAKPLRRVTRPPGKPSPEELWARYQPELRALPARHVTKVNLDVPTVVRNILTALPKLLGLRDELAATFKSFPFHLLDALEDYARVLDYAHVRMEASARISTQFAAPLMEEAKALRSALYLDVKALASRGLLDPKKWSRVRKAPGYRAVASDLATLAKVLLEGGAPLRERILAMKPDIARAIELSNTIKSALSDAASSARAEAAAIDERARAFTLAVRAYDQLRRAIIYMRHDHGDVDQIAPSLFAGRDAGRREGGKRH